jgi:hypothetical protein
MRMTTQTIAGHRPDVPSTPVRGARRVRSFALPFSEENRGESLAFAFLGLAALIALVSGFGQWLKVSLS